MIENGRNGDTGYGRHYYGDVVRRLLVLGGIIMILTLPFFKDLLPVPLFISIAAIVIIGVVPGLMNPRIRWVSMVNFCISLIGLVCFEYFAVDSFTKDGEFYKSMFFWTNQALALIFFIAIYFGTKTLRGFYINKF